MRVTGSPFYKSQAGGNFSVSQHPGEPFLTAHISYSGTLTLAGLAAVHGEVRRLVRFEPRLLHSGPIDLDFVGMTALSNQHLINPHCT